MKQRVCKRQIVSGKLPGDGKRFIHVTSTNRKWPHLKKSKTRLGYCPKDTLVQVGKLRHTPSMLVYILTMQGRAKRETVDQWICRSQCALEDRLQRVTN